MLEDLKPPVKENLCQIAETALKLEPADAQILLDAAANIAWPVAALRIALRNKGINLTEKRMYAHRKGECPCSKN
jgi:hypothetical protein